MKRNYCLSFVLLALFGMATPYSVNAAENVPSSQSTQQAKKITGKVVDAAGEPIIGASVLVKGSGTGAVTDIDGRFSVEAPVGSTLEVSFIGYKSVTIKVTNATAYNVTLQDDSQALDEVVVTAMGIKKERKALGYAIDNVGAEELMKNKSANAINSLAGKVAGVTITQTSGAAGAGSQIVLRGGTSLERDNQPLFVVDGVIYDNSTSVIGNSQYDGMTASSTTNSNRVMDINPEDIEDMSVLKGPAASALYGSRAAAGVVIITTKKGQEGTVEINLSAKYLTSWVKSLPQTQTRYKRGFYNGLDANGNPIVDDYTTDSWGEQYKAGEHAYDNVGDFFQNGGAWDTNVSVSGGSKTGNFFLSGSFYDQDGNIPTTGYTKTTFRFNGEQKWKMFTFGANVAYSQSRTAKTLTSAGLWGSGGTGSMVALYGWPRSDNMSHYLNEDGSPYRMFEGKQERSSDVENPYWMLDNYRMRDDTERFTGSFSIKADITDWWWITYRMGVDSYTTENSNRIAENAAIQDLWRNGMMSENSRRYQYLSTNLMTNFSKSFGDFNFNLMLGTATDNTKSVTNYRYGWNFIIPEFYSFGNISNEDKYFVTNRSNHRLVGVYGEFRADWKNTVFLTVTGRNDWSSTLPQENRSYFYPSVSGSLVFTQFLQDRGLLDDSVISFGKIRASWARVGKDASPYATTTYLNPSTTMLGGFVGYGTSWNKGNPVLKPEMTESTEIGLEMRFFKNRLFFDYAYYTNNSLDQIISPRGAQSTGYIFCAQNIGNVYNKGMEFTVGGTPIKTKDFTWSTSLNMYGNRGTVKNLPKGTETLYVTDVQFGGAQAASFNDGPFLGISGYKYQYTDDGKIILDKYGMPTYDKDTRVLIGNREPKLQGGFNNTLSYKNWTFNMAWEFRLGGDIYNGTDYYLVNKGLSDLTLNRESLTISGVQQDGDTYKDATFTFEAGKTYNLNGAQVSGQEVIQKYYKDYYYRDGNNYITKVNSLRLRTLSLGYDIPKVFLNKLGVKRASVSATANNLLLITNYRGDPESSAAGSGVSGSGAIGIEYCGVPATASFSFGVNLTF
ncbi:SusC/RagA family TonB-linked outer membrane protein [Bacteroides muris (ex Fokt et al. 2023)]|uniref:SusC/RagA family TonB-linked outer membrane protein n=1 Tax=Bacteroides muris (ex Fokt et al. 2023) TaxID=2937417 RepID=A0A9X2NRY8_9BACE|nr:SusC/RagA family TonB-linked outer membrane protein [Bacteroides muris (ex Fokt et al. 2023)]MCR6503737.1 SusC/RagA family TonB-linked outer membrane protein [Bacteroides muris (ex Fokt et al. 2023)]